jgi:hypothetical protein
MRTRWQLAATLVCALPATFMVAGCGNGTGPEPMLDQLSDPDTNTAVVMVDRDVVEGSDTVKAGVEEVYLVDTGRAWETLAADAGVKQVMFTVGDPYATDRYLTDAVTNTFRWIGPTGTEYYPVLKCAVTVRSAFVADTPSTLWLETACDVAPLAGGGAIKVLVKARRFGTPQTGP